MKILSVHFLNLNSLKGEHTIRFDQPPFTDSGLFAITGPTGSGKTTILDAITVALYGRVHRHDKNVEEMMSRNTSESWSEVEFEVQGKQYRAKWSKKRSRGKIAGTLQGDKSELCELPSGTPIGGHTATLIKQAIIDLCGLDYDQFLRSVILSQGDFTRFLKASDSERSGLLEKITGTGIYSAISKWVYERKIREKYNLDTCRSQLNGSAVLPEEERSTLDAQLKEYSVTEDDFKKQQTSLADKINWLRNLDKVREREKKTTGDLAETLEEQEQKKDGFLRLGQHEQASAFQTELAILQSKNEQAGKLRNDSYILAEKLPGQEQLFESAKAMLENTNKGLEGIEAEYALAEPLLEKASQMDNQIKALQNSTDKEGLKLEKEQLFLSELQLKQQQAFIDEQLAKEQLKELNDWLLLNNADKELEKELSGFIRSVKDLGDLKNKMRLARADQEIQMHVQETQETDAKTNALKMLDLEKKIIAQQKALENLTSEQHTQLQEHSLESLNKEAETLPELIHDCEEANRLAAAYLKNLETNKALENFITDQEKLLNINTSAYGKLIEEREELQAHVADLGMKLGAEQRIQNYEEARGELQPDQPCFLCGSLNHPFLEDGYHPVVNETELKKNKALENLAVLEKRMEASLSLVTSGELILRLKKEEITDLEGQKLELLKQFNSVNACLPKPLEIEKHETITRVLESKKLRQGEIQRKLFALNLISVDIHEADLLISKLKGEIGIEKEKSASIAERIRETGKRIYELQQEVTETDQKQNRLSRELEEFLKPYSLELDHEKIEETRDVLVKRSEIYIQSFSRVQELTLEYGKSGTELENLASHIKEKNAALQTEKTSLTAELNELKTLRDERKECLGERDPAIERNNFLNKIRSEREHAGNALKNSHEKESAVKLTRAGIEKAGTDLSILERSIEDLHDSLLRKLHQKNISSIELLQQMLLLPEEAEFLTSLRKGVQERLASLRQELNKIKEECRLEQQKALTEDPEFILDMQLEISRQQLAELYEKIGKIKQILNEDTNTRNRFSALAHDIEIQQQQYIKWEKLDKLIGSADGKKFSRFAQGLTLARLTELANIHLSKLSDRYQILKSSEDDLELLIIDAYQADAVRPMATLSGGESFLVSLALAFGLSDLASKKVQIDTLFIDEGFGSLDADTLDTAISALENLQSRGKMIGIISHVEALKERISTQIQLSKQSGGISKIFIESYMGKTAEA